MIVGLNPGYFVWDVAGYAAEATGPVMGNYKHNPQWSLNKGLHSAVYNPGKVQDALSTALADTALAIKAGDTNKLGVAIATAVTLLVPGAQEVVLARTVAQLHKIDSAIVLGMKAAEKAQDAKKLKRLTLLC